MNQHEPFRIAARERWGSATPYRLGLAVGRAGASLPPPAAYGPKARHCYREGIRYGRADRRRLPGPIVRALRILDEAHGSGY